MRWVFVAQDRIGQRLLRDPGAGPQEIACVVSDGPVIRRICRESGLRCEAPDPETLAGLPRLCQELGADLLINVHGFHILPASRLAELGLSLLNVHPSSLPDLAGVYPFVWAIQYGRAKHGVTIHHMVDKTDAGDVVAQTTWALQGNETAATLFERCEQEGERMVRELLNCADAELNGRLAQARPQDLSMRSYRGFRAIRDVVEIDASATCEQASALFRSRDFRPFPPPWPLPLLRLGEERLNVVGLAAGGEDAKTVRFRDGDLRLTMVTPG